MFRAIGAVADSIIGLAILIVIGVILLPFALLGLVGFGIYKLVQHCIKEAGQTSINPVLAREIPTDQLEQLNAAFADKVSLDNHKKTQVTNIFQHMQALSSKNDHDHKLDERDVKEIKKELKKEIRDLKKELKQELSKQEIKDLKNELAKQIKELSKDSNKESINSNVLLFKKKAHKNAGGEGSHLQQKHHHHKAHR